MYAAAPMKETKGIPVAGDLEGSVSTSLEMLAGKGELEFGGFSEF
jgi:hypothetical protein